MKNHNWSDYSMLVAWLSCIAYTAVGLEASKYGVGVHQWNVPAQKVILFAKWGTINEIMYPVILALVKLSICLQFQSIFITEHNAKFWCLQIFIWINMFWFTACMFISIFQCNPRERAWNPLVEGKCLDYQSYITATGVFTCLSDVCMLLFPLWCISRLRMSMSRKLGVIAVFLVGLLAVIASIFRIVFSVRNYGSHDATYTLTQVAVCTSSEIAAGILVGNLVVLPKFFTTYRTKASKYLSSYRQARSSERTGSNNLDSWPRPTPYVGLSEQDSLKTPRDGIFELKSGTTVTASIQEGR